MNILLDQLFNFGVNNGDINVKSTMSDEIISAHKIILVNVSDYFKTQELFPSGKSSITELPFCIDVIKKCIHIFYSTNITEEITKNISIDNLIELFHLITFLCPNKKLTVEMLNVKSALLTGFIMNYLMTNDYCQIIDEDLRSKIRYLELYDIMNGPYNQNPDHELPNPQKDKNYCIVKYTDGYHNLTLGYKSIYMDYKYFQLGKTKGSIFDNKTLANMVLRSIIPNDEERVLFLRTISQWINPGRSEKYIILCTGNGYRVLEMLVKQIFEIEFSKEVKRIYWYNFKNKISKNKQKLFIKEKPIDLLTITGTGILSGIGATIDMCNEEIAKQKNKEYRNKMHNDVVANTKLYSDLIEFMKSQTFDGKNINHNILVEFDESKLNYVEKEINGSYIKINTVYNQFIDHQYKYTDIYFELSNLIMDYYVEQRISK
ncbi:hypothetical protein [Acanthamoeba castellanii mimivirus]|uniref:Uncharacterized protein L909 n=5 Tax=Mimivirus TaxID=315393 RepID=YL909_MIMIV|nr:hypothetical protein MIMI_gp0974 [Acanthamoeba polyphaga mimivirus]Q5UQZ9.1 RecName: Full=Uncharacterized protein L909 [Acanthamoeba polyphaga mimivirus]AEQ61130.1 N-terminal BTB domain-containing protein [Acanthamoeba castellanii mamavirus]AHA44910.1 hypothetical protein HIRU_S4 [Hirudovirus strain Sangsue]ALR84545.1 N-terminal BTB domain-containing protein [Niemeyer virus]AMK62108.1 hypothetical protein [Samba virus]AMZ03345.1 hypothetical protein [Mimivirus Bombay]EJN40522.1 hypothetic